MCTASRALAVPLCSATRSLSSVAVSGPVAGVDDDLVRELLHRLVAPLVVADLDVELVGLRPRRRGENEQRARPRKERARQYASVTWFRHARSLT